MQKQKILLDKFLNEVDKIPARSNSLLEDSSPYQRLVTSYFEDFPTQYQQWIAAPYNQNSNHPEHLNHKCLAKHYVRSKSEVIIANALFTNQIPYRYECELSLENTNIYPDFTILHPRTLELYYWEHFGMMDNEVYRKNACQKIALFGNYDIYPSINLITTFETSTHPIQSDKVQKIIEEYFL